MPRLSIPMSGYSFPRGKPIPVVVMPFIGVAAFIGLAVRWSWSHGHIGWDGVLVLTAPVVTFGILDYRLLRFYEGRGRPVQTERSTAVGER